MSDPVLTEVTLVQVAALVGVVSALTAGFGQLLAPWRSLQRLVEEHHRLLVAPDHGHVSLVQRVQEAESELARRRQADRDMHAILTRLEKYIRPGEEETGGSPGA